MTNWRPKQESIVQAVPIQKMVLWLIVRLLLVLFQDNIERQTIITITILPIDNQSVKEVTLLDGVGFGVGLELSVAIRGFVVVDGHDDVVVISRGYRFSCTVRGRVLTASLRA